MLFTDGADMKSDSARYEDNINAVEESGVIVYPIRYDTRAETEAMLRSQGGLGGIIKSPPVGTTPTTVPGGDRASAVSTGWWAYDSRPSHTANWYSAWVSLSAKHTVPGRPDA